MERHLQKQNIAYKEFFFQLVLHALVFSFYVIDSSHPSKVNTFHWYDVVYFLNYTMANLIISYVLLPRFFYKKNYVAFFGLTFLTIALVIVLEELGIEKWFFPDSRGTGFPGVIFSLAQVLPVIVILSGFKFAWDALRNQRKVEELKAIIKEGELTFLKSQINPHFLFNNLNNLYSYAVVKSSKTPEIILELSSVLRYMLYECKEASVPLSKEIEHLRNFTRLYEMQIEERGEVTFEAPTDFSGFRIAPLILNVFIENAFKHSQTGQSEKIKIAIKLSINEDGNLIFICQNNYKHPGQVVRSGKGIGLINVKKRLKLLYPDGHVLDIQQSDIEYKVTLKMALNRN
ncbi:sensor histidine kinase [Cyclobacterium amurskyense]|uniref:Putative two-component system sensor protein n=1 Tax=Cyclobacterium amurskyense TaxID=320787 RepID=A0A0H4PJN3_9BACT|nr:histidine kinase [Cyclobacterium amurskyense]AKP53265.1 Putative two-component system sensor protein [Cyclobacterium amurskyense]|tara:strand:- start:13736 stop:14770 length:1035 start_codon:yes stop_codon:yes gene_type:complete